MTSVIDLPGPWPLSSIDTFLVKSQIMNFPFESPQKIWSSGRDKNLLAEHPNVGFYSKNVIVCPSDEKALITPSWLVNMTNFPPQFIKWIPTIGDWCSSVHYISDYWVIILNKYISLFPAWDIIYFFIPKKIVSGAKSKPFTMVAYSV